MQNKIILVRHAKTKVDKSIPIENWILTTEGNSQAEALLANKELLDADVLISSSENKSFLTLKPLSEKISKEIVKIDALGEIKRPNSEKLTLEQYEEMKVKIFKDLNYSEFNWETSNHALNRFKMAVEQIDKKYSNKKIVICAHGTVMTLYFAYLQNQLSNLMKRWKSLEFGVFGVVKNNKVIKDIV